MKKILIVILAVVFFAMPAFAQTWYPANQRTVAWSAVSPPTDDTGQPWPGSMKYQVYARLTRSGATEQKIGGEITATQQTVTFTAPGKYFIGVDAVYYYTEFPDNPARSDRIAWSDNPLDCLDGKSFGVVYLPAPGVVSGLK